MLAPAFSRRGSVFLEPSTAHSARTRALKDPPAQSSLSGFGIGVVCLDVWDYPLFNAMGIGLSQPEPSSGLPILDMILPYLFRAISGSILVS